MMMATTGFSCNSAREWRFHFWAMEPGERSIAIDRSRLAGGIYYCVMGTRSARRVLRVVMRGNE
ncbi:MAG TPA: hypothetical protein VHI13_09315 [Candidatus Kapabacteria bacterium]|nr:hypothetical protein [Candidatus Kapabacteria bacterium]